MDAIVNILPLGQLRPGQCGRVISIDSAGLEPELEERLLRMGIAEDAVIQVLHEGPVRRDPVAVKVDGVVIAMRRREASAVLIEVGLPV